MNRVAQDSSLSIATAGWAWLLLACVLLLLPTLGGEPPVLALRYERAALARGRAGGAS